MSLVQGAHRGNQADELALAAGLANSLPDLRDPCCDLGTRAGAIGHSMYDEYSPAIPRQALMT